MGLEFDEATSKRLERMYATRDMVHRRRLVREALAAVPGERILDVGCGPGFYVSELLDEVGPTGSVVGVDASREMLALAQRRCEGRANAEFREGDATAPPVDEADFDGVICVQVLEYVADATDALAAMCRALRPGGRAVVWDTDWTTMSWHSSDQQRMDRVLKAFDDHLVHPALPRTLTACMRAAGFSHVHLTGHSSATTDLSPDTHGGAIMPLIANFAPGHQGVTADEVEAWEADQRRLAERGEFFFACTQFCFTAIKPEPTEPTA